MGDSKYQHIPLSSMDRVRSVRSEVIYTTVVSAVQNEFSFKKWSQDGKRDLQKRTLRRNCNKKSNPYVPPIIVVDEKEKHKREVRRLRMIKRKRRMKMTDRGDDIRRDPNDSDEFVASDIPVETPQEEWLNDLLAPSSLDAHSTQQSTKPVRTLANGDHVVPSSSSQPTSSIQETFQLSSLIQRIQETIANHPIETAFFILVIFLCHWLHIFLRTRRITT